MKDTTELEKNILSTLLQSTEHEDLLHLLSEDWFCDENRKQVLVNLKAGSSVDQAVKGTTYKMFDLALLIKHNKFPSLSYGYAEQLKDAYLMNLYEREFQAVKDGGKVEDSVSRIQGALATLPNEVEVCDTKEAIFRATDGIMRAMDKREDLIYSPFGNLNSVVGGLMPGRLVTIAGRPGTGKSAFVLQMATSIARRGHKVLYVSLEMLADELAIRLLSTATGINSTAMSNGTISTDQFVTISGAAEKLKTLNLYITNYGRDMATLERIIKKEKPSLVIVDSLNLMRAKGESERVRIMSITRSMKELTIKLNLPIIMVAQLSRIAEGKPLPDMTALKESGSIEEDSDIVILLAQVTEEDDYHKLNEAYKDKTGNYFSDINGFQRAEKDGDRVIVAIVAKNRNGATGKVMYLCKTKRYEFIELPEKEISF